MTGANGHLGANLVRRLMRQGAEVRALVHRSRRSLEGLEVETVQADVLDPSSLRRAFGGVEVVYHLAGTIDVTGATEGVTSRVNVEGTANVVEACLERGIRRLVHVSSSEVLRPTPRRGPVDDGFPLVVDGPIYHRTKADAERVVQAGVERGLDAVIVRPSAILGPWDFGPSQLGRALLFVARGWLPALVEGGHDWVDARDVAAGMIAAADRGRRGEAYLLTGRFASFVEVAHLAAAAAGRAAPRPVVSHRLAGAFAPLAEWAARFLGVPPLLSSEALEILSGGVSFSHDKASRELGYVPRPLESTVKDTIAWFREQGMLDGGPPTSREGSRASL